MSNHELQIIMRLKDEVTKRMKGIQGSMRRFAKSFKENWLAITAAITAAIIAVRKAWDLIEIAAKAEQQEKAFGNLAFAANVSSEQIVEDLRKMSGETLSTAQIMEKASQAMILGIAPEKLAKMMEISRASARAFGKDVGFMFESIAIGVGRQSKLILDNLGIIVSAKEAYQKYADSIGESVQELTEAQRKQAFLNATLEAGQRIVDKIDTSTMTHLEQMQKIQAQWDNMVVSGGHALKSLAVFGYGVLHLFNVTSTKIVGALTGVLDMVLEHLEPMEEGINKILRKLGKEEISYIKDMRAELVKFSGSLAKDEANSLKEAVEIFDTVFTDFTKENAALQKEVAKNTQQTITEQLQFTKGITSDTLRDIREAQADYFDAMAFEAQGVAVSMENAFSDLFYKPFVEGGYRLKDFFTDLGRSILRVWSDMLAKMLVNYLETMAKMHGGGGTNWLSILGTVAGAISGFAGGGAGTAQIRGGATTARFHRGGMIRAHNGLAVDEVPIIAQRGEYVLSRRGVSAAGGVGAVEQLNRGQGGGMTVHIHQTIRAWNAEDVFRHKDEINNMVAEGIMQNTPLRSVIKRYGST